MNIFVLDNSRLQSGVNHYSLELFNNLSTKYNLFYENVFPRIQSHYYIYILSGILFSKINYNYDIGIYTNFMSKTQKFKKELIVIHDTFLWDYGKLIDKLIFKIINTKRDLTRIYVSKTTKQDYAYEGEVIYPFINQNFWKTNYEGKGGYILTDYGNYPYKNIDYYEKIYQVNDRKFYHLGGKTQNNKVLSISGDFEFIAHIYSQAELLIFLSEREGFGYPMAQGGIMGVPIITKDIPIVREVYGVNKYYDNDLFDEKGKINKDIDRKSVV